MSNETNLNAAQTNHIIFAKGGKMYKKISFMLAAALAVNLFAMVAPTQAQLVQVPNVVGLHQNNAVGAIRSAGLVVKIEYEFDLGPRNYVLGQEPSGGTWVSSGSTVTIFISWPAAIVPDVVGMAQADAESVLRAAGFYNVIRSSYEYSNSVPEGHVISQDPQSGELHGLNYPLSLYISLGPQMVEVPDVRGMTEAAAGSAITSAGLVVGNISRAYNDFITSGRVFSQDPLAPTLVAKGTPVDLIISLGPQMVEVPDVMSMAQAAAESAITAADLAVGSIGHENSDTVPEGHVISQVPLGGTLIPKGSAVDLTISSGPPPVEVPDVVGMVEDDAKSAITSAGLSVGTIGHMNSDTVAEGHVISQNPSGGTSVAEGSEVNLAISLGPPGPEPVDVPDVVGMAETEAGSEINSAGFDVWYSYEYSDTVEEGRVISQDPAGGTSADEGSDVNLTISLGPPGPEEVEVPDVVGMSESDAKSVITSASLNVGPISNDYSDSVPKGFVISQSPAGGTSVSEGYSVLLTISLGPEPVDVPSVGEPVAHWKLDETEGAIAYDSSGNGNHGMVYGSPIWKPTGGMLGGALELDGVDDSVVHSFAVETWSAYTVTLWVKTDTLGQNVYSGVFSSHIPLGAGFQIDVDGGYPGNYRYNDSVDQLIGTVTTDWVHLAAACDGSIARLYYNGNLAGTIAVTDMKFNQFAIGVNRNADNWFAGIIDDVRIYDYALSADNILQLLHAEPIECLVAHWKLDETSGITAGDSSGNGNHGILYGDPTWQPTGGIIDGTLEFDGDGDYVEIPKIGGSVEFTYAMWVAQNQVDSGLIALIDHKDWVYGSVQFELRDGHPKVGINGAITPAGDLDAWGHTLAAGEWHHVALAKSATELLMYVDGEEAARRGLIVSDTVILGDGCIGVWVNPTWGQTRYFDGWVDDVRIYECALDENQIKSLMSVPPSLNPLSEALDTSLSFTTGGSADWFSQTTTFYNDGDAAQSGDISDDQESWMQTTVSGKGTVKFYWKVSSEEEYDCLEFYIDGVLQEKISGLEDYWVQMTYTISTSGSHVLEWRYMKDGITGYGSDCGWVDKVEWVTTP